MAKGSPNGPILLLAAAGGGLYYAKRKGLLQKWFKNVPLQERVSEAQLHIKLDGFHANTDGTVMADITMQNPSSIPLQVQSILGNIVVAGKIVGQVKMFGDTVVRPNDESTLPVNVRVMPQAIALFRRRGQAVAFQGEININNIVRPLTMQYTL